MVRISPTSDLLLQARADAGEHTAAARDHDAPVQLLVQIGVALCDRHDVSAVGRLDVRRRLARLRHDPVVRRAHEDGGSGGVGSLAALTLFVRALIMDGDCICSGCTLGNVFDAVAVAD